MSITYGERLLAGAQVQRHRRMAKRRAFTLLVPCVIVAGWSTAALIGERQDRLGAEGAALARQLADPLLPVAWTMLFVLMPLWWSLKADPLPAAAGLAFMAGPIMTPVLFGPGGWAPWHIGVIAGVTWLVLGAAAARRRRFPLD